MTGLHEAETLKASSKNVTKVCRPPKTSKNKMKARMKQRKFEVGCEPVCCRRSTCRSRSTMPSGNTAPSSERFTSRRRDCVALLSFCHRAANVISSKWSCRRNEAAIRLSRRSTRSALDNALPGSIRVPVKISYALGLRVLAFLELRVLGSTGGAWVKDFCED